MSEKGNHISELFRKYRTGNFSRIDQEALDKKVQEDPYVSDAMEGLKQLSKVNARESLTNLDTRLKTRIQKDSSKSGIGWMSIAAGIAIVITATLLIWSPFESDATLASEQRNSTIEENAPDDGGLKNKGKLIEPPYKTEPIIVEQSPELIVQLDEQNNGSVEIKPNSDNPFDKKAQPTQIGTTLKQSEIVDNTDSEIAIVSDITSAKENSISQIESEAASTLLDSDAASRSTVASDQALASSSAAPSASAKSARPRAFKPAPPIDAERSEADMADLLPSVIEDQQKREASNSANPIDGIESYNKYIKANLVFPAAATAAAIKGEVVLLFNIDANGSPVKIEIKTSLGYGCDEEAIRLLRNGPKWTPSNLLEKSSVTIEFR